MAALLGEQEAQRVARLGHRDMQSVIVQADRHGHVLAGHVFGDEGEGIGIGLVAPEVRDRHAEELGQRADEVALFEDAHLDEELTQAAARLCLQFERLLDLLMRDEAPQDEYVTQLLTCIARGSVGRRHTHLGRNGADFRLQFRRQSSQSPLTGL